MGKPVNVCAVKEGGPTVFGQTLAGKCSGMALMWFMEGQEEFAIIYACGKHLFDIHRKYTSFWLIGGNKWNS